MVKAAAVEAAKVHEVVVSEHEEVSVVTDGVKTVTAGSELLVLL